MKFIFGAVALFILTIPLVDYSGNMLGTNGMLFLVVGASSGIVVMAEKPCEEYVQVPTRHRHRNIEPITLERETTVMEQDDTINTP